ncbi:MAG: S1 RNA-binding domain-containing protein [Ruminococcaceae bacterium]|nr:S1 RNA-binding domain-containing protein [Oscillospiraceae bacterium]
MTEQITYYPEGALTLPHQYPYKDLHPAAAENKYLTGSMRGLESAMTQGKIIEAQAVLCDCRTMDLQVELGGGIRGIIPREEVCYLADGSPVKDIAIITRVGKPVQCRVTGFERNGNGETVVRLSRKAAQKECTEQFIGSLRTGDIIPARVTHLENFGAFVDIGAGIVSLITVDCISVSRIAHPRDRFAPGDFILSVVRQIDRETGRIYMSHRELLGTWEENAARFSESQTVTGIVRSIEEYGIFVELAPNLAGLAEYREDCLPGDGCSVYIKSIIPERMKIKLVMIDTCDPPPSMPLRYRIEPGCRHMDNWLYSPACCRRRVESVFTTEKEADVSRPSSAALIRP